MKIKIAKFDYLFIDIKGNIFPKHIKNPTLNITLLQ